MKKTKFRGIKKVFIDATSTATPVEKDGKMKFPKVLLDVKINAEIPFSHRICK